MSIYLHLHLQTSENDLPFCAPNAVCSKIDLYETPWIERQCRCPRQSYAKHYHTVYHAKEMLRTNDARSPNYRHVLEQKLKFGTTSNSADSIDYDLENEHIKSLLQKLGVIYNQDDIMSLDNDFHDANENPLRRNTRKRFDGSNNALKFDNTRFRHSGHHDMPRLGGCPSAINDNDEHTITDKTRLYKLCEPVHKLPLCR